MRAPPAPRHGSCLRCCCHARKRTGNTPSPSPRAPPPPPPPPPSAPWCHHLNHSFSRLAPARLRARWKLDTPAEARVKRTERVVLRIGLSWGMSGHGGEKEVEFSSAVGAGAQDGHADGQTPGRTPVLKRLFSNLSFPVHDEKEKRSSQSSHSRSKSSKFKAPMRRNKSLRSAAFNLMHTTRSLVDVRSQYFGDDAWRVLQFKRSRFANFRREYEEIHGKSCLPIYSPHSQFIFAWHWFLYVLAVPR